MADKQQDVLQSNNPLSKKLNKILDTRFDNDKEMLEALKALSEFFTQNNLRSRRNLRGDIEKRSLAINENFVDSFRAVKEQLDSIYGDVKAMNDCCEDMTSRLKNAKEQTHDLIDQTTKLQAESQKLAMRAKVADAFLDKFQLKQSEIEVLRGPREGALHVDFFKALARVKEIHTDCKVLLRTNQQTAGLEIMEAMALHQESAYERLYRWAQNECRSLTGDSPDISSQLCQAMAALHDRPVLFKYSVDEFGTARRTAIVRGFIDALTRGAGGSTRPIELHSHDPLRYTGDMLAWLHQATASEKEHIQILVKLCPERGLSEQISDVLSHVTDGLCRPFKVRVEQVLVSEPGSVILYKLANLIKFYHSTIGRIVADGSALLGTLHEMYGLSMNLFYNSLALRAHTLVEKAELPPADLGPTGIMNNTVQLLRDILSSHDSSVLPLEERKQGLSQIMCSVIEPLLQMCSVSASRLNTTDMATYMINCLHLIHSALTLYEFTDQRLEMLQAQVDAHVDTLVSEQATLTLNRAGLSLVYDRLQPPQHRPLVQAPNMDPHSLQAVMSTFDSFLASPDSATLPQCSLLLSATARDTVRKRSLALIIQSYEQLYTEVNKAENQYPDPQRVLPRSPQQVSALLL